LASSPEKSKTPITVLGIDPGLGTTGYSILRAEGRRLSLCEAGVIRTEGGRALEERLLTLYRGLKRVIRKVRPDVMVVEELHSHYLHPLTAIKMAHARGVIYCAAAEHGVAVESYAPTHVKKAITGNGHASKEQMQRMVQSLLGLPSVPEPADVADALALSLCHINVLQHGG